jgi:DNA-binding response OmpR family regulator
MTYAGISVENKPPLFAVDDIEMQHRMQKKPDAHLLRCMVVDDDGNVLKIVADMLTMLGFQRVDTAQMKPELMNKLATGSYDLLVTDLEMPDMNGFELSHRIKKEVDDTKVIIMTGRHKNECLEMMETGWADGWLFKPFGVKELCSKLIGLGLYAQ